MVYFQVDNNYLDILNTCKNCTKKLMNITINQNL